MLIEPVAPLGISHILSRWSRRMSIFIRQMLARRRRLRLWLGPGFTGQGGCLGEIIPLQAAGELETDESEDGSIGH